MTRPIEMTDLARMSARIGCDPSLVQGPGGNTSLKLDGRLWVKASGCWLADADDRQIFVPLSLSAVRAQIQAGEAESFERCIIAEDAEPGLKPSIETAFHALMPHRVVVHAHAVNCMTVSVLTEGETLAREQLGDELNWAWIPYHRPGRRLAGAIEDRLRNAAFDVLLLQNHGVIVGAGDPWEAEQAVRLIEDRLRLPARELPPSKPELLAKFETAEFRRCDEFSSVALDDTTLNLLTQGALIPDQAVFLGGALPELSRGEDASQAAARVQRATGVEPTYIAVRGAGVLQRGGGSKAAKSLLGGLIEIASRIPAAARISRLSNASVQELLDWDAERFRRSMSHNGSGA